jgi:hypothetical protein
LGAKLGDNAAIILAAILTACGVALLFLPWQALSIHADPNAPSFRNQQKGEIVVGIGKPQTPQPDPAKPHNP